MHFMLDAQATSDVATYLGIILPSALGLVGVIFGGTGFWQWKQAKDEAKRLKEEQESSTESKLDNLIEKVDGLADDTQGFKADLATIKTDISLLQRANEETIKYREHRGQQDKLDSIERKAIIESLCGMMRERLLENYKKCIKKGYYTREEREIYSAMFECYEKEPFNGDGVMHDMRSVMRELPWTAEDAGVTDTETIEG